jgi:hypothetical protein
MTLLSLRPSRRRRAAGFGACLALAVGTAALVAGCGSSGKTAATTTTGRSVQVLATVQRGDLVDSVTGRLELTSTKNRVNVKATVQMFGQNASQVAAGQPVTVSFVQLPAGARQSFGQGSPPPSAAPSAGSGGQGYSGTGGGAGGSQGFFGQGGGQGALRGKTAQGTVTAVQSGSSSTTATATITIAKLPAGVTAKYTGIAQIQVKVLASNVLIIPTAAIKGSGANATVQLLVNGKTSVQSVVVGQQTQTESEITSGLSAGQNVVYTRTFTGRFPGSRANGQSGGQGLPPFSGQSNGAPPGGGGTNGAPPSGATSGT